MRGDADARERLACSIEALSKDEQRALIVELTSYANFLIQSYPRYMPRGLTPRGYDAPCLAHEAILRVLDGRRRDWNPAKEASLLDYLKSVVKSIMSSEILPAAERGKSEIAAVTEEGDDLTAHAASPNPGPDQEAEVEELKERILSGFNLNEDQMVLICLFEGVTAPAAIAEQTGLAEREIFRIKQKIRRRLVGLREED
jgi:hypothetical protein